MNSLSDQEVDQHEQDNTHQDMRGIGRSYECVFCKRGFNTAQALGGHMNIHRKDKARNKPSSTHSLLNSKHEIQNSLTGANLRCYQQVSSYIPTYHEAVTDYSSCLTYFPASSTSTDVHDRQCLNLFGDNWGMNLSLQFGAAANVIESTMGKNGQENNLDLELRLGHHDP